jgi:hypothetical protein
VLLGSLPIGLGIALEQLRSFGRSSGRASISSCQWQSLGSSDDMTFAGGISPKEHVGLRPRREEEARSRVNTT